MDSITIRSLPRTAALSGWRPAARNYFAARHPSAQLFFQQLTVTRPSSTAKLFSAGGAAAAVGASPGPNEVASPREHRPRDFRRDTFRTEHCGTSRAFRCPFMSPIRRWEARHGHSRPGAPARRWPSPSRSTGRRAQQPQLVIGDGRKRRDRTCDRPTGRVLVELRIARCPRKAAPGLARAQGRAAPQRALRAAASASDHSDGCRALRALAAP